MSVDADRLHLTYILECIANVEELTANGRAAFEAAKHDQAAALYYLHTMAESTQRLSDALKSGHAEIDWIAISGFRNRLVHGYLNVNVEVLWSVIENSLPELKRVADTMLKNLGKTDENG